MVFLFKGYFYSEFKNPLLKRLFKSYVSKGLEEKIVLTELHYVATFLHPNLKSLNMITVEEKQKTIRAVKALLITLGINTIEPEMEESIPLPKKNRLNISQQFMDRAKKKDEVIVYERAQIPVIGNDQCILKWWMNNGNMFPSVQSLAYKIYQFLHHLLLLSESLALLVVSLKLEEVL